MRCPDGGGWKNQPPTSANPPTAAVPLNRHSTPPPSSKHRSISPIRTPHSPAVTTMVAAEDPESFFATAPPLEDAGAVAARLQEFVARNYSSHASSGTYQLNRARPAAERTRGHFIEHPGGDERFPANPCEPVPATRAQRLAGGGGSCASRRAGRRCRWSSGACATSTTSAPATAAPRPPSKFSRQLHHRLLFASSCFSAR